MSDKNKKRGPKNSEGQPDEDLPFTWQSIQSAIWLIGIAILFWKGWWFPGILVLVAISGIFQAAALAYIKRERDKKEQLVEAKKSAQTRGTWLPSVCPGCGGPISVESVNWTGPNTADCPYCKVNLKPTL